MNKTAVTTESLEDLTMDEIITGLGDIRAAVEGESRNICQAAIHTLFALSEAGARTAGEGRDLLYDYRALAKQYQALHKRHEVAGNAILKDGVWHCPDCRHRVAPNHSFCHRCGKKLGWR